MEELSAVVLLQDILFQAMHRKCTDVHLHTSNNRLKVQFRIAGNLYPFLEREDGGSLVVRRIKALARMDVTETRIPQDGAFSWQSESLQCDIRVASVPTVDGEAMVMRLLSQHRGPLTFTSLGMTDEQSQRVDQILRSNAGLILVAGSTGSGKTTTLYAMMVQLSRWGRNVVSIEDPVEMPLPTCRQIEVREQVGVTFGAGLKALLRQDPDVIMIGEIRDEESARVALRASLSGHLVLSTTHARDVIGAAARLVEFGMSRVLVADVLKAVIIPTLQNSICSTCQGTGRIEGSFCGPCEGSGKDPYRTARFELCEVTHREASLLASDVSWHGVREALTTNTRSQATRIRRESHAISHLPIRATRK